MKETIDEALELICNAIVALYHEDINPSLHISVLRWCEAIDEDNEPILINLCKKQYKVLSTVYEYPCRPNERTLAVYALTPCIKRLSGYDDRTCFDDSCNLIDSYLNRNNKEEEQDV